MTKFSNSPKKINLLILSTNLHIGGSEVVIKNLVNHINKRIFSVIVVCIREYGVIGEELFQSGYDIISLNSMHKQKVNYFTFLRILKIIRKKKIDVVHTHSNDALADAGVCKIFKPKLKLIHTFHFGNYLNQSLRKIWIEQVFSRFANRVIAVGKVQRNHIKKVLHLKEDRISTIWNGISITTKTHDKSLKENLGIGNQLLIGTICTLTEQKGLFDLLLVAKKLVETKKNVCFIVVGDGPLRSTLEMKQKEYGLENIVIFTGWMSDAAKTVLPFFDIFFQPSLWEAMSIVILEAMMAGKPILATNVGENSLIIENQFNGLLIKPQDIQGMVNGLTKLINNSELRNSLGNAAREKAKNHFTAEKMTQKYEKIYIEEYNKR